MTATIAAIIGAAGCVVGLIGVTVGWAALRKARKLREQQKVVLGGDRRDLLEFAIALQGRIDDVHTAVDEVAAGIARVDRRMDGALVNRAIVRYDAYDDTGGHQSASAAVLDSTRSGFIVTAIQGRDYARIYMKDVDRGRATIELSPEESEAVERAMGR